jgi:hypothetical protein
MGGITDKRTLVLAVLLTAALVAGCSSSSTSPPPKGAEGLADNIICFNFISPPTFPVQQSATLWTEAGFNVSAATPDLLTLVQSAAYAYNAVANGQLGQVGDEAQAAAAVNSWCSGHGLPDTSLPDPPAAPGN